MNSFDDLLKQQKKMVVEEYRKPEAERSAIWNLVKGFIVDANGELTDQGKAILADVEAEEEKAAAEATPKKKKSSKK